MGLLFTKCCHRASTPPTRILMLGLEGAGKTTILYHVMNNRTEKTIPTEGFNAETVSPVEGVTFIIWDIGGQEKYRALWKHYYPDTKGLMFVMDSSNVSKMDEAISQLCSIMEDSEMFGVPVVVFANKQDLPGALSTDEVAEKLSPYHFKGSLSFIQGSCATTGDGIYEGMEEMSKLINRMHCTVNPWK